jgi:hypothetical protein
LFWLVLGAARYARPGNYSRYLALAMAARKHPWSRAMFLDLLLSDIFICEVKRTRPNFSSLFLNAAAHIQHHYMFNSPAYSGEQQNPAWYVEVDRDPVGQVYQLYDRIVARVQDAMPNARLMVMTGLHQDPHPRLVYYWRLKDHARFLARIGAPFETVEPRMSRDFVVRCATAEAAAKSEDVLLSVKDRNGVGLFEVDNRGSDLFVTLGWPHDIDSDFRCWIGDVEYSGLKDDVAFVAIKNGQHNGVGYFIDTGAKAAGEANRFPLSDVPRRICDSLGVDWEARRASSG